MPEARFLYSPIDLCTTDIQRVESELNSICQWACFKKKKTVIIAGDLNLDRLRLDRSEGNSEGPRRSQ